MRDERKIAEAEVRLCRAQESYAHAMLIGDLDAAETARAAVAASKRDLADARPPGDNTQMALAADIQALRDRLVQSPGPRRLGSVADDIGYLLETPAALGHDGTLQAVELASALGSTEHAGDLGQVAVYSRRALLEGHQVALERLGEQLAKELSDIDGQIAASRVHAGNARTRAEKGTLPFTGRVVNGLTASLSTTGAALLGLAAAYTQLEIATRAFDGAVELPLLAGAGYVATAAYAARLAGQLIAHQRAGGERAQLLIGGVLLALTATAAIVVSAVAASSSAVSRWTAGSTLFGLIGLLFIGLFATLGYRKPQVAREPSTDRPGRSADSDAEATSSEYAVLIEARHGLLRLYIARASSLLADSRRLDALYVREALLHHPEVAEELLKPHHAHANPDWLFRAVRDLDRAEGMPPAAFAASDTARRNA